MRYPKLAVLFTVCLVQGTLAHAVQWDGWGVVGGNHTVTGGDWNDMANWDTGTVPTPTDDVVITFDTSSPYASGMYPDGSTFFELVPNGAVGQNVSITNQGLLGGGNSRLRFESGGTMNFETFHVNSSNNRAIDFQGATLILSGGSVATPSFLHVQTNSLGWTGTGPTLEFTGSTVVTEHRGTASASGWHFTNAASTIDASGYSLHGGGYQFHPTQTISNLPFLSFSQDIVNLGAPATRLDNLSGVGITSSGGTPAIAAGTYAYADITRNSGASGSVRPNLAGDTTLASSTTLASEEYALILRREGRSSSSGHHTVLSLDNSTLSLTGPNGSALVGRKDYNPEDVSGDGATNYAVLNLNGTSATMEIAKDLILGPSGVLAGAGTIELEGNFVNDSRRGDQFDATSLSLQMLGSGTQSLPQELEVHGIDMGEGVTGFTADNFAFDELVIGAPGEETFVRLVDLFDNGPVPSANYNNPDGAADALYLNSLLVNEGSTLDLNGLNVYVNGNLVEGGSGVFGAGSILPMPVPEPSSLGLMLLGTLFMLRKRKRS